MKLRPSSDMNVTPLIDVLLVLLVIFLAALPIALRINRQEVAMTDASARFREIFAARRDKTLFVRGDGPLRYGEIMALIDLAKGAGVDRIGIITDGLRAGR